MVATTSTEQLKTKQTSTVQWLAVSAVATDPQVNTRSLDTNWVDARVPSFDLAKLGVPEVSKRKDGTYIWLDGQHRAELVRRAGWPSQKIQCRVHTGLTLAEEALLFLGLNGGRQVTALAKFLARRTAQDPDAVGIDAIVRAAGWHIASGTNTKSITAVSALEKAYNATEKQPGKALAKALRVVTEAWGYAPEAVNGDILLGVSLLLAQHDRIDIASLIHKLADYTGGPRGLHGTAKGLRPFLGGTTANCVAATLVKAYNAKRTTGALPDWR
jgi:hypothetical protein